MLHTVDQPLGLGPYDRPLSDILVTYEPHNGVRKRRHVSQRKCPDIQNWSKDTRLANDFWTNV